MFHVSVPVTVSDISGLVGSAKTFVEENVLAVGVGSISTLAGVSSLYSRAKKNTEAVTTQKISDVVASTQNQLLTKDNEITRLKTTVAQYKSQVESTSQLQTTITDQTKEIKRLEGQLQQVRNERDQFNKIDTRVKNAIEDAQRIK